MWNLRRGVDSHPAIIKGRGGKLRPLRKDEIALSNEDLEELQGSVIICQQILGKKAYRPSQDPKAEEMLLTLKDKLDDGTPLDEIEDAVEMYEKGVIVWQ